LPQELPKRHKVGQIWRVRVQPGKRARQSGQPAAPTGAAVVMDMTSPSARAALSREDVYGFM